MISGVIFILAGEAMLLASRPHALWALTFLGLNLIYIPLLEEPLLRRRFGEAYLEYCKTRTLPNKRLKLAGAYRSSGNEVLCPCRGTDFVQRPCAGGRVARSLSAIR